MNPADVVYKIANKEKDFSNKVSFDDVIKIAHISQKILPDPKSILPDLIKQFGTGITLTNSEIKDIMKVIKFLENTGILLKGTTRKLTSQEGGFSSFLKLSMKAGLPLVKNVIY